MAVGDGDATELNEVAVIADGTITLETPVAAVVGDEVTVVIAANYLDDDATPITAHPAVAVEAAVVDAVVAVTAGGDAISSGAIARYSRPTVKSPTFLKAGAVAQWEITSANTRAGLTANVDKITVAFSTGSVPSSIDRADSSCGRPTVSLMTPLPAWRLLSAWAISPPPAF